MSSFVRVSNVSSAVLFGMLALALFVAAACSDDDDGDGTAEPTGTTPAMTSTSTMTETPEATETEMATETPDDATETPEATGTAGGGGTPTVSVSEEGDLAPFLVDADGMTLYIFTNDEPGVSNCTGDCLTNWPPLTVEDGEEPVAGEGVTGELAVIEDTGHVMYNDQPLYYYAGDQAAGDTNGHEVGDVWFVVEP